MILNNTEQITTTYGEILKITTGSSTLWKKPLSVDISCTTVNSGSILLDGEHVVFPVVKSFQDVIDLSAVPNSRFKFSKWSDNITDDHRQIELSDHVSLTAIFVDK